MDIGALGADGAPGGDPRKGGGPAPPCVRRARAPGERARVGPQGRARSRAQGGLCPLGHRPPPVHLGVSRRGGGGIAGRSPPCRQGSTQRGAARRHRRGLGLRPADRRPGRWSAGRHPLQPADPCPLGRQASCDRGCLGLCLPPARGAGPRGTRTTGFPALVRGRRGPHPLRLSPERAASPEPPPTLSGSPPRAVRGCGGDPRHHAGRGLAFRAHLADRDPRHHGRRTAGGAGHPRGHI